jgi:signal transduction histidine kinase
LGLRRLEELLHEFRDFVRATALAPQPLDINDVVRECVDEVFPKRGPVTLSTDYAAEPLPVQADPLKLKRAFGEIIENAVTFQPAGGGGLHVATRRLPASEPLPPQVAVPRGVPYAHLSFRDQGPGINDSDKANIFRPFFTSRNRGMGLGLAIVKGIIEAHKGDIIETGTPGRGACFEIFLPLVRDESE